MPGNPYQQYYNRQYYASPRGYYPYPANYGQQYPKTYEVPKQQSFNPKLVYPALLILAGIVLVGLSFIKVQKVDSRLLRIDPSTEVAAVVFCDPCTGISGERIAVDRVLVADKVSKIVALGSLNNVKQIQYLYPLD